MRVEAVGVHGEFDGVGDQVAAGKDPLHSLVPLGDAVAEADGIDFKRDPAPGADPLLGRFGQGAQMDMAGVDLRSRC